MIFRIKVFMPIFLAIYLTSCSVDVPDQTVWLYEDGVEIERAKSYRKALEWIEKKRKGGFYINGGIITNNSGRDGGGVMVGHSCLFVKTGGVITGYLGDPEHGNKMVDSSGQASGTGHVVICQPEKLNRTVGEDHYLDSRLAGSEGGWIE